MSSETLKKSRIESIDILRGFTLFGIMIVHMVEQFYAGQWPEKAGLVATPTIADSIVSGFVGVFIIGKFYMIFSFLFGLSFYIQFSRSDSEKNFLLRFLWRLTILFAIGLVHHLHYRGDILTIYALLGSSLVVLYRLPDKYLLALAVILILNVPVILLRSFKLIMASGEQTPFVANQDALLTYFNTLKSGSYFEILKANLFEFKPKISFQIFSGRLFITLGLFLLGIYAGRKGFFRNVDQKIPLLKSFRNNAWIAISVCVVLGLLFGAAMALFKPPSTRAWEMLFGGIIYDIANASLAIIYVMWILLWLQKEKWQKPLSHLYPVGRMGLTVYLMQTLLGSLVFFSWGLGLLGDIGALACAGLAILFFLFQIVFARYWFRTFLFGPVEWIWRSITYLEIQPLRTVKPRVRQVS